MNRGHTGNYGGMNRGGTGSYGQSQGNTRNYGMNGGQGNAPRYGQSTINSVQNFGVPSIKVEPLCDERDFAAYYNKVPLSKSLLTINHDDYLGVDLVLELQGKDATTFSQCFYYCGVCKLSLDANNVLSHLSDSNHKFQYLILVLPDLAQEIRLIKNGAEVSETINLCASKLTKIIGPVQMPVVMSYEQSKGVNFLQRKVNSVSKERYYNSINLRNLREGGIDTRPLNNMKRLSAAEEFPEGKKAKMGSVEESNLHYIHYGSPEFEELIHEWHESWPYRKILLAGDDSCRYFKEGVPPRFPNVVTVTKEKCSLDDAIAIVEESCDASMDFVLIHAFQWAFLETFPDENTGETLIKAIDNLSKDYVESMISKMVEAFARWKALYPDIVFQFLLPFPINFEDVNKGAGDTKINSNSGRFLKHMKDFNLRVGSQLSSKWVFARMSELITVNERLIMKNHGFENVESYMNSLFQPTSKLIIRFWKMIYEHLAIRHLNHNGRRVVMSGKGPVKTQTFVRVKYDVMVKKIKKDPGYGYFSGHTVLLGCGQSRGLHSEVERLIPQTTFYQELTPDSDICDIVKAVEKRGVEGVHLLLCSPFQWILKSAFQKLIGRQPRGVENSKKKFESNIDAMILELKNNVIRWRQRSPGIKVICILPFPTWVDTTGKSNVEIAREKYFAISQYNLIKYITRLWHEHELSNFAPMVNLDEIVLEGKHETFIDGNGNPEWLDGFTDNGMILPNFSYIIWDKIYELCMSMEDDNQYLESKTVEWKALSELEKEPFSQGYSQEYTLYYKYRAAYLESINIDPAFFDFRLEFRRIWRDVLKQGTIASSWPKTTYEKYEGETTMASYNTQLDHRNGADFHNRNSDRNKIGSFPRKNTPFVGPRGNNWELEAYKVKQQRERMMELSYGGDYFPMEMRGGYGGGPLRGRGHPPSAGYARPSVKRGFSPLVTLNMLCESKDDLGFLGNGLVQLTRQATEVEQQGENSMELLIEEHNKTLILACTAKISRLGEIENSSERNFIMGLAKSSCDKLMKEMDNWQNQKNQPENETEKAIVPFGKSYGCSQFMQNDSYIQPSFNYGHGTYHRRDYSAEMDLYQHDRSIGRRYNGGGPYPSERSMYQPDRSMGRQYKPRGSYSSERGLYQHDRGMGRGHNARGSYSSRGGDSSRGEKSHVVGPGGGKFLKNQKRREQRKQQLFRQLHGIAAIPPPTKKDKSSPLGVKESGSMSNSGGAAPTFNPNNSNFEPGPPPPTSSAPFNINSNLASNSDNAQIPYEQNGN